MSGRLSRRVRLGRFAALLGLGAGGSRTGVRTGMLATLLLCLPAIAQERAFVEVVTPRQEYFVGERVPLTLRVGYDRDFFRDHAVPLFPRRTDVLLHVRAQVPGEPAGTPPRGPTLALNDDIVETEPLPDETRDGRVFNVLACRRIHVPKAPGELAIPAPTLRFVHATAFDEDFVIGRVARDPKDGIVEGKPLTLRVLPLPSEGRPPGFQGAVGRFTVRAETDRASVDAGEILGLTLTIEGEGTADTPRLDLPGFHVYGTRDDGGAGGRTIRYEIAPIDARVTEIPAITFAYFDPGPPPGYHVARTEPIPLEVRGRPAEPTSPPTRTPEGAPAPILVAVAILVAAVLALVLWLRFRRPAKPPPDPEAIRIREAFAALRARTQGGGTDLAGALAEFLSAYLRCPPAAVIGPDLATRLSARGLPADLAARTAAKLEHLVAARYGAGAAATPDIDPLLAEIDAHLPRAD